MKNEYDLLILGGGAAGFFTAINAADLNIKLNIAILERGKDVLTKVKVSGGGRCNVTHAEFIPKDLATNYPRGEKELVGPFHTFMTGDTIAWFETKGVALKMEEDGRMFPVSDSSQTIIDCFTSETERLGIEVHTSESVKDILVHNEHFEITTTNKVYAAKKVVVATGSNPKIWNLLEKLGHTIVPPVPSLFTFHIKDTRIADLPGIATHVSVQVLAENNKVILSSEGPLLITHWGMSGPAILKLSAWGARLLEPTQYQFTIKVNWLEERSAAEVLDQLLELKHINPKQTLQKYAQFDLPKRLWQSLLKASAIDDSQIWAAVSKKQLVKFSETLTASEFQVTGKSTFKEEFGTAGGIDLKEVNFKTFESKLHPNLYFAGEVLNIDAITGGFNFQNAWTGGFIVAKALTQVS